MIIQPSPLPLKSTSPCLPFHHPNPPHPPPLPSPPLPNPQPTLFSDPEVIEQIERVMLDEGAVQSLIKLFGWHVFRSRLCSVFDEDPSQRYFKPPSPASAAAFEAFEKGERKICLLPGWREVDDLPGGAEEKAGIKALARFIQLEEGLTVHVLHHFQKDLFRRGLATEMDRREYGSLIFYERVRRFYHDQRVYFLKYLQELFRIDQDRNYPKGDLRQAVRDLIDQMDQPSNSLCSKFQVTGSTCCPETVVLVTP